MSCDGNVVPVLTSWPRMTPMAPFGLDFPRAPEDAEIISPSGNDDFNVNCIGESSANPKFMKGPGTTIASGDGRARLRLIARNCVIDELDAMGYRVLFDEPGENVAIRFSHIHHQYQGNGITVSGTNILIYKSEIDHHEANYRHGIQVSSGSDGVWILENHIHHNGDDGFQACHGCSANPPRNIYMARNRFHSSRENAIDLKYAVNFIASENIMWGYEPAPTGVIKTFDYMGQSISTTYTSGSDGTPIVVGADGGTTGAAFYSNVICDSALAFRCEEGTNVVFDGNTATNISGNAIVLQKQGEPLTITNNYFNGIGGRGLEQSQQNRFQITLENNYFLNVAGRLLSINDDGIVASAVINDNRFHTTSSSFDVKFGRNFFDLASSEEINTLFGGAGNQILTSPPPNLPGDAGAVATAATGGNTAPPLPMSTTSAPSSAIQVDDPIPSESGAVPSPSATVTGLLPTSASSFINSNGIMMMEGTSAPISGTDQSLSIGLGVAGALCMLVSLGVLIAFFVARDRKRSRDLLEMKQRMANLERSSTSSTGSTSGRRSKRRSKAVSEHSNQSLTMIQPPSYDRLPLSPHDDVNYSSAPFVNSPQFNQ